MTLKISARSIENAIIVDCHGRIVFGDESSALREIVKEHLKSNPQIVINLAEGRGTTRTGRSLRLVFVTVPRIVVVAYEPA